MGKCLVVFCKNSSHAKCPDVTFHRIPRDRYELWLKAIGRDPSAIDICLKSNRICSEHFTQDSFLTAGKRRLLKSEALPTLKLKHEICAKSQSQTCIKYQNSEAGSSNTNYGDNQSKDVLPLDPDEDDSSTSSSTVQEGVFESPINLKRKKCEVTDESTVGKKTTEFISTTDSEGLHGTPKKRRRNMRMFHNYCLSPRKLREKLNISKAETLEAKNKLKVSTARVRRLTRKVDNLKVIVNDLSRKRLISDDSITVLKKSFSNIPHSLMKRLVGNINRGKTGREKFPEELRSFAMTLQFYSAKAYDYVRKTFHLALPAPSVIRSWMSTINCEPGYIIQAFKTLEHKFLENKKQGVETVCSLMLDEMSIKKQIYFACNISWGYVDMGTNIRDDELKLATEALVLMVISVNQHWKLPIAYFLIHGLNGKEKANIVMEAVQKITEIGVTVVSVTCDGPSAHFTMVSELGAQINNLNDMKPFFINPIDQTKVFVIFDACHLIKLVRNNWASLGKIIDSEGNVVDFSFIEKLFQLQEKELLRFGTKLRKAHLQWQKQKMKVNLAVQTLSNSVADALQFLMDDIKHPDFEGAEATIKFIRMCDKLFDLCNSKNAFGRGCKTPMKKGNEDYWRPIFEKSINSLKPMKTIEGQPLYITRNKTPFKGFIITATALLGIYDEYVRNGKHSLNYLLTYKMSQDHLELFFFSVRSRNGSNNNPTAYQFHNTFRILVLQHELIRGDGNCVIQDETSILVVPSGHTTSRSDTEINLDDISYIRRNSTVDEVIQDHNYPKDLILPLTKLSENVVTYIAGFVIKMLKKQIKCDICILALEYVSNYSSDDSNFKLYNRKNRGGLIKPSMDVVNILLYVEGQIRILLNKTNNNLPKDKDFMDKFGHLIYLDIMKENKYFKCLEQHIFDSPTYSESHVYKLIKSIILGYIKIRFYSIAKKQTEQERGELIRKTYSKLILFKHQ